MASASSDDDQVAYPYSIIHIPHDEAGIREYLSAYKAFRLLSLQLAPEAFSSTYEREIAFDDETWYGRLSNPGANTFMAVRESGQVISTATMIGPLPYGTSRLSSLGNPWAAINGHAGLDEKKSLHFRLNGIFTLPEARRRGTSKELVKEAIEYTQNKAQCTGKSDVLFSVIVEADNEKARALYESAGFVQIERLSASENPFGRPVIILEYRPCAAPIDAFKSKP